MVEVGINEVTQFRNGHLLDTALCTTWSHTLPLLRGSQKTHSFVFGNLHHRE